MLPIEAAIRELEETAPAGAPVLSLYLLTDPSTAPGRKLSAQIQDLLHGLKARLADRKAEVEQLERTAAAARRAAMAIEPPPRSLAVFARGEADWLRVVPLPLRMAPRAFWDEVPQLQPLHAALDEHERTAVVLIDKERARLFRVFLDQIEELESVEDYVPARHRQVGGAWAQPPGGWAQGGWGRTRTDARHEVHMAAHAHHAIEALSRLLSREAIGQIIVGGSPEMLAHLRLLAPKPVRARIIGVIHVPMFALPDDVLAAAREVVRAGERSSEVRLVEDLLEQVGAGQVAFGAEDVVAAANERRIALLVYAEGTGFSGGRCAGCGLWLLPPLPGRCPVDAGEVEASDNLLDEVIAETLRQGSRVEAVSGPAAERLTPHDGVAALVYYRVAEQTAAAT